MLVLCLWSVLEPEGGGKGGGEGGGRGLNGQGAQGGQRAKRAGGTGLKGRGGGRGKGTTWGGGWGQAPTVKRAEQSQQTAEGTFLQLAMHRIGKQSLSTTKDCSWDVH